MDPQASKAKPVSAKGKYVIHVNERPRAKYVVNDVKKKTCTNDVSHVFMNEKNLSLRYIVSFPEMKKEFQMKNEVGFNIKRQ